jgi:hypothetical protein
MLPLIILAAIMAVVFYVYQLSRHVLLGFFSLLAVELLSFTFGTSQGLLAGFHLDPMDFIGICLLLAGCIRTARNMNRLHVSRLLALVYIALLTVSIVHGLVTYDLKSVANESRSLVPSVTGMLYFLTAPTDAKSMRRYTWLYLSFGIALCIVAATCKRNKQLKVGHFRQVQQRESPRAFFYRWAWGEVRSNNGYLSLCLQFFWSSPSI